MSVLTFAAEAPNGNFLPGDINEFYWGVAAFLVVVLFLLWKVRPVIVKAFRNSKEKTQMEVAEAEKVKKAAEAEFQELQSKLSNIGAERERILAEAKTNSQNIEKELRAKADQDAKDLKSRSSQDVEISRIQTQNEIKQHLARVALNATESIVAENLSPKIQSKLLDDYIKSNLSKK